MCCKKNENEKVKNDAGAELFLWYTTPVHLSQVESKPIASKTAGNQDPLVSVVIPCYNQARYLDECISSVLEQSFGSFEIIVVDDGSNNPEDISLLDHADYPRTTLLRQANQGPSAARNAGIRKARGKYILPLDADDKIAPRFLELCVGVMERNPESDPSWFGFLMTVQPDAGFTRNDLAKHLEAANIQTRNLFAGNILRHPCCAALKEGVDYRVVGELKNTDTIMNASLWIGLYPGMGEERLDYMVSVIRVFCNDA